jgi:hypothetical protein
MNAFAKIRQELMFAEMRQAEIALERFYAKGPHKKKKPGRPGFWKSPHGCFFVWEVERIKKERKYKTAAAIRKARKETIDWAKLAKAYGIKDHPVIARAATLAKQTNNELQVRYQEARKYWLFVIDPEAYRREQATLQYNFEQALAACKKGPHRSPYDFS